MFRYEIIGFGPIVFTWSTIEEEVKRGKRENAG
jgi:hypothetical protein